MGLIVFLFLAYSYLCVTKKHLYIMNRTYNFYCDESTHLPNDGEPYMVLGYVSIPYPQIKQVKKSIRTIIANHNFKGELKWTNVHEATLAMYQELVDYFFSISDLNFRAIIVDKSQIKDKDNGQSYEDFYFKMYYQLIHHQLDFSFTYNLFLDIKDTCSHKKLARLKDILCNTTPIRTCQFVRSHEVVLLQLADVLMGAVNYNLRVKKRRLEGRNTAKSKIVAKIKKNSDCSLEYTSNKSARKFNLFFINLEKK